MKFTLIKFVLFKLLQNKLLNKQIENKWLSQFSGAKHRVIATNSNGAKLQHFMVEVELHNGLPHSNGAELQHMVEFK